MMTGHPHIESTISTSLPGSTLFPSISDHNSDLECVAQAQGNKDGPGFRAQLRDMQSSWRPAMQAPTATDEIEGNIIETIRTTDVTVALRRLPAGFYAVVQHSCKEWRTENKPVSVEDDMVEWNKPIPIPSDPTAMIRFRIYASFELQPMLGNGEQLQELTITVRQLLNRSANNFPFTFCREDDVLSPCSSMLVTVKTRIGEGSNLLGSRDLEPQRSTTETLARLEDATDQGHAALSRYRKHGERRDLEHAIEQFERALDMCSPSHPCRAAAQSNLAVAKFIHCLVNDTGPSFDIPLTLYRSVLSARPAGHPDRPSTLIQLAIVFLARLDKLQNDVDAAQAGAFLREAMDIASTGSREKRVAVFLLETRAKQRVLVDARNNSSAVGESPASLAKDSDLLDLGTTMLGRFKQSGHVADLQHAISLLETSVRSTSVSDHMYCLGLRNLGTALVDRFMRFRNVSDLDQAISRYKTANECIADGHPDKPLLLVDLGNSFSIRFQFLRGLDDLGQAISTFKAVVDLVPNGHLNKSFLLASVGTLLFTRFKTLGGLVDLEEAISWLRDAVNIMPQGHPCKLVHARHLSDAFRARFDHLKELTDLDEAIQILRHTVDLTPDAHPEKPCHLDTLGCSFRARFECLRDLSDLDQAISTQRDAVNLTPDGHPHKDGHLQSLGISFITRFKHLGELDDLEQAISKIEDAVNLVPDGHCNKPGYLNHLGDFFFVRFERLGQLGDVEKAISRYGDANDLSPKGHQDTARLRALGSCFKARFMHTGEPADLDKAILKFKGAIVLSPDRADRACLLNNLGQMFKDRFHFLNEPADLDQAISSQKEAVAFTPDDHPHKLSHLNCLAISFGTRFEHLGKVGDLDEAILRWKDVVHSMPDSDSWRLGYLGNLANSFRTRFMRFAELSDLEQAILIQKKAVSLAPEGHSNKAGLLNDLGTSFSTRFECLGESSDLEQAISKLRDAVDITPDGHPLKSGHLNNLSTAFSMRFKQLGDLSDLGHAITMIKDAIAHCVTQRQFSNKHVYVSNLGTLHLRRFEHLGELSDLEEAISQQRNTLNLTNEGHPENPQYHGFLGDSLRTRFDRFDELKDLEEAISRHSVAVDLTPDDHPEKSTLLQGLARSFEARFKRFGESGDLERAVSLYSQAACASIGSTTVRFRAAQKWITSARALRHHSLWNAYAVAISLLPQLAWIGLSITRRFRELLQGAGVVREAAAAALDLGQPEAAVEWLEQGRSIVWGELFQLRGSHDELSSSYPDHARRLRELSAALEHASAARERSLSLLSAEQSRDAVKAPPPSLEQESDRHRALAIERDKLLREIRGFPGFERFLLYKEFSELRVSAHAGPVVFLNAAESRCDALIILANKENVAHVPLPEVNIKQCEALQDTLDTLLGPARLISRDDRAGRLASRKDVKWEYILSTLWEGVIKPVLDALGLHACQTADKLPRIFWCPTGPFTFLPIHAAGLYGTQYREPGNKVSDFVISSYVPTLSTLTSTTQDASSHNGHFLVLGVPQPPSDCQPPLPGVHAELEHIRTVIEGSSGQTALVESSVGTVEEVLGMMKDADWVHFACHGVQDPDSPGDSGLCLADGRRLKLSDVISLSRPRGGLAFLSACQTAMGDKQLSDEAVHVAAGMLFAGYEGVIGTMWSISDRVAPEVAKNVYDELVRTGGKPDHRGAARALHNAVARLRNDHASFVEWVPFIHVGL